MFMEGKESQKRTYEAQSSIKKHTSLKDNLLVNLIPLLFQIPSSSTQQGVSSAGGGGG
jgi:hypothetical protein|uniref:Uncharacterized protein n=1 Tax=Picea sitchensis TaxID=3332 RepID=A0A6B9XPW7_PICSI|nr:hypothetical protein Q903MT_gene4063 [Picea sitchensis]